MPLDGDEFAEFDTDEASFDAMMSAAEPAELVRGRPGTTVVIEQAGGTVFTVAVPPGGFLRVGTSTSADGGESVVPGPGKLAAHHSASGTPLAR